MSGETPAVTTRPPAAPWSDPASRDALQLIAEGVTQLAGFGIAAISVVREDGTLQSIAMAGSDAAKAQLAGGSNATIDQLIGELELADDWGHLRFVPFERLDPDVQLAYGWVPDIEPIDDAPDAWHPLDLLIAPLYDESGQLRGTLSMDLPEDGRRPGEAKRAVLNMCAEQAGRAVMVALEREALAEQVRLAEAARQIVRKASAQLNLERIVADIREGLIEGFRAAGMWIQTFSSVGDELGHIYSAAGVDVVLSPELVSIAEGAAQEAWESQRVAIVAPGRGFAPPVTEAQGQSVLEFLHDIEIGSALFVPLGAGPEVVGNLVLTRLFGDPDWTESDAAAALDIGHDLGRAILNARTFEREHLLVRELQKLDQYKGELIATVAHELKNPLSSVLGHLEMLESSPDFTGTTKNSLASMERGAQRMVKVIDDLLLLSEVGDPETPVIAQQVDLRKVVHDVVDLVAVAAQHKHIRIRQELPDEPAIALGDPVELDRICGNLLSNAVKYTPAGGSVVLTLTNDGTEVEFSCRDEGIGISAEDLANLGTEFFRSSNPAALVEPGTGLGLAIVRRIVARHGGRLDIESELGVGSTFRVRLPAS